MKIILVRHAPGDHQLRPDIIAGRCPDAELTSKGIEMARSASRLIIEEFGLQIDSIDTMPFEMFSSPSRRARQTAEQMIFGLNESEHSHKRPSDVRIIESLDELSQGDWEGRPRDQTYTENVNAQLKDKDIFFAPPKGESIYDATYRMLSAVEELHMHAQITQTTPVAVTHNMAIKSLLGAVKGWSRKEVRAHNIPNVSMSQFDVAIFDSGLMTVGYPNHETSSK